VELVDTLVSEARAERCAGSSPVPRTNLKIIGRLKGFEQRVHLISAREKYRNGFVELELENLYSGSSHSNVYHTAQLKKNKHLAFSIDSLQSF
jgi:hypothetical protein